METVISTCSWLDESNWLCDLPNGLGLVSVRSPRTRPNVRYQRLELEYIGDESSFAWKYFGFLKNDSKREKVYCALCNGKFKFSKSTICLQYHLQYAHDLLVSPDTKTLIETASSVSPSKNNQSNRELLNVEKCQKKMWANWLITSYLINDLINPDTISGPAFLQLLKSFVPEFDDFKTPPISNIIKQQISDNYFLKKIHLEKELELIKSGLALTVDIWKDVEQKYTFLTFNLHFLSVDWQKEIRYLCTQTLPFNYLTSDIVRAITVTLDEWALGKRNPVLITEKSEEFMEAGEELDLEHLLCFGHTLNDVVFETILSAPEINALINKCKDIINFIKLNENLVFADLVLQQRLIKIFDSDSREINFENTSTTWCATLTLLKLIQDQYSSILCLIKRANSADDVDLLLTSNDVSILKELIVALSFFETATEVLSSDNYPFLGLVYPAVKTLTSPKSQLTLASVKTVVVNFQKMLRKRLMSDRNWSRLYMCGTALDPRFKSLLDDKTVWDVLNKEYQERVVEKCDSQETEMASTEEELIFDEQNKPMLAIEDAQNEKKSKFLLLFSDILEEQKLSPASFQIQALEDEIRSYHHFPISSDEIATLNVHQWWKENSFRFPLLSSLAKNILMIPAISIPSTILFTTFQSQFYKQRSYLPQNIVDKMSFLHHNNNQ